MLRDDASLMSRLMNGAAIGLCSLVGMVSITGTMALLVYVHLISLSGHQMVVV